jgi:hypothetical protein
MRTALMLILCLAVVGGMGWVLYWFFRRLGRIEQERWGRKVGLAEPEFLAALKRLFKGKSPAKDGSPPVPKVS